MMYMFIPLFYRIIKKRNKEGFKMIYYCKHHCTVVTLLYSLLLDNLSSKDLVSALFSIINHFLYQACTWFLEIKHLHACLCVYVLYPPPGHQKPFT